MMVMFATAYYPLRRRDELVENLCHIGFAAAPVAHGLGVYLLVELAQRAAEILADVDDGTRFEVRG